MLYNQIIASPDQYISETGKIEPNVRAAFIKTKDSKIWQARDTETHTIVFKFNSPVTIDGFRTYMSDDPKLRNSSFSGYELNYIKKDFSVALMIDQRVSEGEKISFFGKPALTTTLPAQLALKFDLSIVPVFIERDSKNNFRLKFFNQIKPSDFSNKMELTKRLNQVLEKMISNNPYQWIWTHNRWK